MSLETCVVYSDVFFFAHLLKNGQAQLNKIDEYLLI